MTEILSGSRAEKTRDLRLPPVSWLAWLLSPLRVFAGVLGLGMLSGWGSQIWTNDVDAALRPAWMLLHRGTWRLPASLVVAGETHPGGLSDRPAGMVLLSMPGEVLARHPSRDGVLVLAVLLSAGSAALLVDLLGWRAWLALAGSPLLYVAARTLWPETVGVACMVGCWWLLRRTSLVWPVVPLVALATACRPPLGALIAALVAVELLPHLAGRRRLAALVPGSAGIAAGLAVSVGYCRLVFGSWSPVAGYPVSSVFQPAAFVVGLVSPARGLLVWSPWVLAARFAGWRDAAPVALAAGYTLSSWALFGAWGGSGWAGYRYAIPLAVVIADRCTLRLSSWLVRLLVAWSVGLGVCVEVLVRLAPMPRLSLSLGVPAVVPAVAGLGAVAVVLAVPLLREWGWSRVRTA